MAVGVPSNVGYGRVVGRFLRVVGDTTDDPDQYPDATPVVGSVTFTPAVAAVKNLTANPDPVTLVLASIKCTFDSEGYLLGPSGARGVWLVATDDTDNNPSGWTYTVTLALNDAPGSTFSISVVEGSTQDVTTLVPVTPASGVPTAIGPKGDPGPPGPTPAVDADHMQVRRMTQAQYDASAPYSDNVLYVIKG